MDASRASSSSSASRATVLLPQQQQHHESTSTMSTVAPLPQRAPYSSPSRDDGVSLSSHLGSDDDSNEEDGLVDLRDAMQKRVYELDERILINDATFSPSGMDAWDMPAEYSGDYNEIPNGQPEMEPVTSRYLVPRIPYRDVRFDSAVVTSTSGARGFSMWTRFVSYTEFASFLLSYLPKSDSIGSPELESLPPPRVEGVDVALVPSITDDMNHPIATEFRADFFDLLYAIRYAREKSHFCRLNVRVHPRPEDQRSVHLFFLLTVDSSVDCDVLEEQCMAAVACCLYGTLKKRYDKSWCKQAASECFFLRSVADPAFLQYHKGPPHPCVMVAHFPMILFSSLARMGQFVSLLLSKYTALAKLAARITVPPLRELPLPSTRNERLAPAARFECVTATARRVPLWVTVLGCCPHQAQIKSDHVAGSVTCDEFEHRVEPPAISYVEVASARAGFYTYWATYGRPSFESQLPEETSGSGSQYMSSMEVDD